MSRPRAASARIDSRHATRGLPCSTRIHGGTRIRTSFARANLGKVPLPARGAREGGTARAADAECCRPTPRPTPPLSSRQLTRNAHQAVALLRIFEIRAASPRPCQSCATVFIGTTMICFNKNDRDLGRNGAAASRSRPQSRARRARARGPTSRRAGSVAFRGAQDLSILTRLVDFDQTCRF